ncbi:AAA family ATPase [Pseudomonas wadenswilerensis]|uniref:AAA family ATPase n=1 Tax=Pseudomonas wadenswilerensis TaxID=1785161 RepID=UPI002160A7EA|nr:AAA family ATPase [Pseudomonas wadenswilerensis]UVM24068.1 AAA family ATPase [Pseudomonas wadenswilerensis]
MIRIERGPMPEVFSSAAFTRLRSDAEAFYQQPAAKRAQARFGFQRIAARLHPDIRLLWSERQVNKCAYCEQLVSRPEIELFRPRYGSTDFSGGVSDDHYWWLAFEWSNYLPSCAECNALKGPRFPVQGPRARVGAIGEALRQEKNLLLDPAEDDLDGVFLFLSDGKITSETERGQATIDVLGLNRSNLIKARSDDLRNLEHLQALMKNRRPDKKSLEYLAQMVRPQSPFCAMRRQFVRAWAEKVVAQFPSSHKRMADFLSFNTALGASSSASNSKTLRDASRNLTQRTKELESFSIEQSQPPEQLYRMSQYIERVEFRHVRAVDHLQLEPSFSDGKVGSWYMLLGENGTGKSTLLQALACALIGQSGVERLGVQATDLLQKGAARGEVRVELSGMSEPIVMTLTRRGNKISIKPAEPKVMVLAYGATRLMGKPQPTDPSAAARSKVENLFDPTRFLDNGVPWLNTASSAEFNRFARSLASLLPSADGVELVRRNHQIIVKSPSGQDTLTAVSSGYQAVLALAMDIMSIMRLGWQDMSSAEGIVLIDEVDAHLHPRWRMRIVQRLREVFPRVQFIATSHEPLTLRGLDSSEIAVLTRTLDGPVTAMTTKNTELPSPRFMRVDQLLASEYFGLHSTEDVEIDRLFEEYYRLLAMEQRSPGQQDRLQAVSEQLRGNNKMGLTPREHMVYEAADRFLAERMASARELPAEDEHDALIELKSLWAEIQLEPAQPVAHDGKGPES